MKIAALHLLLLLFYCEGTEYYVRPTESTNSSCAGQPCLILSHYISNSDDYFKSNTVFRFLPGIHHSNQAFELRSLENVSLEGEHNGEYPMVTMDIHCSSHDCAGFHFMDVRNLTVHSLNFFIHAKTSTSFLLSSEELPVSGLMFNAVKNLSLHHASVYFVSSDLISHSTGITMFSSEHMWAHSLTVINNGLLISYGQHVIISSTVVKHANKSGISVTNSIYIDILNVKVSQSGLRGLDIGYVHHATIVNTSVTESYETGFNVLSSTNIAFINTSVMYFGTIHLFEPQVESYLIYITFFGFFLEDVDSAELCHVRVMHSEDNGIGISSSSNITVENATVNNVGEGIITWNNSNTYISYTTINGSKSGLLMNENQHCVISNVTISFNHFQNLAMDILDSQNIQIENLSLLPILQFGVFEKPAAISISGCSSIVISTSTFASFNAPRILQTLTEQPAVFLLSFSNDTYFSDCSFVGNNITALRLVSSEFAVSGHLNFTHNRAYRGGAMVFSYGSKMKLLQNGSIFFINNHATFTGGAIYLATSHYYRDSSYSVPLCFDWTYGCLSSVSECFLQVEQYDMKGGLTFVNNSAGQGGDVLYGAITGLHSYTNDDTRENIPCSLLFEEISSITPYTPSQVASDPIRVCYCTYGIPECDIINIEVNPIFPGQSIIVPVIVVGYERGTVAGSVFANFLPLHSRKPQLISGEDTKRVTQVHCNQLEYTIFTTNTTEVLVLSTISQEESLLIEENTGPISSTEFPLYVNISLLPCPPGFTLLEDTGRCDCSETLLQLSGVSCNIINQTILRSKLVWVGGVKDENQTVLNVITARYCPLNYCKRKEVNIHLNEPDTQCEFNHFGTLCGGCQPGLSLMLGGIKCQECSNTNLTLFLPFALAGVVLVLFLKILNLTISEGFVNGLVLYANIVKANEHIFLPQTNINPLTLFIAWLNLDLGIQTCFFNGLNAYIKTWLQFVFPFYIWGIAGVIIISARYSIRVARVIGNNSVPVLATLFLLSYAKLLGVIITALSYTVLEYPGGKKVVWSADGNIDYLGPKHVPLFVAAVVTLLFLWLPYTALLFFGQWLYKCSKISLINHMLVKLKPFLDAHYGPLKDSYRFWFGALLLMRAVILLISALVIKNNFSVFIFSISMATITLVVVLVVFFHVSGDIGVYRSKAVSLFEFFILINLVVLSLAKYHTSVGGGSEMAASYTLIGIAFVMFISLLIFKMYSVVKRIVLCYFPMNASEAEPVVWRYENSIEMQTTDYRNANKLL